MKFKEQDTTLSNFNTDWRQEATQLQKEIETAQEEQSENWNKFSQSVITNINILAERLNTDLNEQTEMLGQFNTTLKTYEKQQVDTLEEYNKKMLCNTTILSDEINDQLKTHTTMLDEKLDTTLKSQTDILNENLSTKWDQYIINTRGQIIPS